MTRDAQMKRLEDALDQLEGVRKDVKAPFPLGQLIHAEAKVHALIETLRAAQEKSGDAGAPPLTEEQLRRLEKAIKET